MRKTLLTCAALTLVALFALTGCTPKTAAPHPTPTPTFAPIVFGGSASVTRAITVPASAHSAHLTLVCSGAKFFHLDGVFANDEGGLDGTCDGGVHRYYAPVNSPSALDLQVMMPTGGSFVLEARFSAEPFVPDVLLDDQCKTMVTVESDIFNAEDGYTLQKLTLTQWTGKIQDAARALQTLANQKSKDVLTSPLVALEGVISTPGLAPGAFTTNLPADYSAAHSIIDQTCSDNGTAIFVNADYGG
jgi:hypothetical protein